MSDIFVARAAVNAEVHSQLTAISAAIATAQTPTEDYPQGLYPDGLTAVLSQVQQLCSYACRQLAPAPEPVEPEADPE